MPPEGSRRPDASMTLITSMLERPLDPGYQAAADARVARGLPPSTGWRTPMLVVYLVLIGLVIGVAAAELRSRDSTRTEARSALIERIQARQSLVDDRSETVRDLQREVDAAAVRVAPGTLAEQKSRVEALQVADGGAAVRGPGLRIELDDSESATSGDGSNPRGATASSSGRVQSRDLQIVVNAVWASGAEAIAINGQRLTSRTAIRFAGEAILVNFRPLTRPYVIEAVGDPQGMQARLAAGPGGVYLTSLQQNYGIPTSTSTVDSLTLPSVVSTALREARPLVPSPSPSGPTTPSKETP